jgi:penicillin V acylase-like amidase (Ntn superfamily)
MKHFSIVLAGCILMLAFSHPGADACSGFQLNRSGQILVGKNYDYMVPDGLVMVNKRGLKKTAMPYFWSDDNPGIGTPASWTAKYGSITLPVRIFEINTRTSGDVTEKFVDYTQTANLDLIKNAFDKTIFLPKMKDEVLDRLAQYPGSFACQE